MSIQKRVSMRLVNEEDQRVIADVYEKSISFSKGAINFAEKMDPEGDDLLMRAFLSDAIKLAECTTHLTSFPVACLMAELVQDILIHPWMIESVINFMSENRPKKKGGGK